jgi:hypothetical protein
MRRPKNGVLPTALHEKLEGNAKEILAGTIRRHENRMVNNLEYVSRTCRLLLP